MLRQESTSPSGQLRMKQKLQLISRRDNDQVIDFEFLLNSAIESVNNMREAKAGVPHPVGKLIYIMELDEINQKLINLKRFKDWTPANTKKSKQTKKHGEWWE